jgi:PST family polysaccharide transporter
MNLLKIVSIIGISTIVTLFSGFIKGKIMAVYFGSSGLGIWSQATNLFMISSIISLFGLNQGLIKQIASKDKREANGNFIDDALSKSIFFSLCNSLIILSAIIFAANGISAFFFNNSLNPHIITFIAILLPFQVVGDVFGVFLLANKEIKKFALANILISIFGLFAFVILIIFFKLHGAYLSVGIYGIITFLFFYFISKPLIKSRLIGLFVFQRQSRYWDFFKNTLSFGCLRLIQVTINPVNMLLIRSLIIKNIGFVENGFFDALSRISILYTPFITNILWSHAFPIYCENKDNQRLGCEINKFIRLSLVFFVPVCIVVMFFGDIFVNLLFSKDFAPIVNLFSLWFIFDLLRITSWPMNMVLIARDKMKLAVSLELFWNITLLLSVYLLIGRYSLEWVILSYIFSYSIFLFINYLIMNRNYGFQFNAITFLSFCISSVLILVSGKTGKALFDYIVMFSLFVIFSIMILNKRERLLMKDAAKKAIAWNF